MPKKSSGWLLAGIALLGILMLRATKTKGVKIVAARFFSYVESSGEWSTLLEKTSLPAGKTLFSFGILNSTERNISTVVKLSIVGVTLLLKYPVLPPGAPITVSTDKPVELEAIGPQGLVIEITHAETGDLLLQQKFILDVLR